MGEKQEKVWVVMKTRGAAYPNLPAKVFDDRQDARNYAKQIASRAKFMVYYVVGVRKG